LIFQLIYVSSSYSPSTSSLSILIGRSILKLISSLDNNKVGVFRGNRKIADAIVEKVYDNLSASGITKVIEGFSIQEGDLIRIIGK